MEVPFISRKTADRYASVIEHFSKGDPHQVARLARAMTCIDKTALYELAKPHVAHAARIQAIECANQGITVTKAVARQLVFSNGSIEPPTSERLMSRVFETSVGRVTFRLSKDDVKLALNENCKPARKSAELEPQIERSTSRSRGRSERQLHLFIPKEAHMSPNSYIYKPSLSQPHRRMRRRIKPSLVTIVGTAYLTLLEYLAAFPESIILACDVQSELDALRIRPISSRHVVTIPFGASDSLQSIVIDHGTPQQVAAAMALPRVSMSNGCSQLPVVGALAMTHVLKRSQFRQLLRHQILPSLHAWAGGELSVLEHLHFQGLSGGSGSLGGLELVRELCSEVNSSWGIPLRSKLHLIGAVSYQGPAFSTDAGECGLLHRRRC